MRAPLPVWEADCGRLKLGEVVVRKVRKLRTPTNVEKILDAFTAAGWPTSIPNPLGNDAQQLHEAVQSLNTGLFVLRFHSQEGGRSIWWERYDSPSVGPKAANTCSCNGA